MTDQVKQDQIEDGLAMSTQLIEPKSNVATGKQDQQLQELKLYIEVMMKKMDSAIHQCADSTRW